MAAANSTADQGPLVRADNLSVAFGRQQVLRDVDLDVHRGQTVAIIGESGCGKTVLLKAIIGLVRPTSGKIYFDGRDLMALSDRELTQQRARFGFVFQNAALFDSLTVAQNVAFPLKQHKNLTECEIRDIVLYRLAQVGLPPSVLSKRPAELSGGMRKRVGLARALVMQPEIILFDEPTTGLDPIMSDVINELIIQTRERENVTSIVVTHDMRTAQKVADRVVMLFPLARQHDHDPQIIFDGTPQEIMRCEDRRVSQFVRGEAGERLMEIEEATL
jgi:phospholipid/cholesterol/gamma-HCH transport system ATP-binding protein